MLNLFSKSNTGNASDDTSGHGLSSAERLSYLKFLESLDKVEGVIRSAETLDEMMVGVLDMALSVFGSDRAWLVYPCDPDAPVWSVLMERTTDQYPGAFMLNVEFPKMQESSEIFRDALGSDFPIINDPRSGRPLPHEIADRFGIRSQIQSAVYPKHGKPWVFGMHQCSSERIWTDEDIILFKEITRRIADGLSSLLFLRALKDEIERHKESQKALEAANAKLELKLKEQEQFCKLAVGRELRIIELKKERDELKAQLARYKYKQN